MENTKTQAQLLAQYPNNNAQEITPERLRDFVVSVSVFGSKRRDTNGNQMIDTTAVELDWDGTGILREVIDDGVNGLEIPVDGDGDYRIEMVGSVLMQTGRTYTITLGVNGVEAEDLATLTGKGDIDAVAVGITKSLVAGDVVSIFCEATMANSDFFLQEGANLFITRLL